MFVNRTRMHPVVDVGRLTRVFSAAIESSRGTIPYLYCRIVTGLDDKAGHRTWVQVRFYQEGDAGPIDHVWTVGLDYNFHETPQLGDTVIVRGFERTVEASGVNEDGSIDFVTRFEGTRASVPLEVAGRAWLAEGVLLMTVPFDPVAPDEHAKAENLLHALDVIGFKSRAEP